MKKLILGIAMFVVGMSKFVELYNITTVLRSTPLPSPDDLGLFAGAIFSSIMFIIGIAGLVVAAMGIKEKNRTKSENKPE